MPAPSLYEIAATVVLQDVVPFTTSDEICTLPDRIIHTLVQKATNQTPVYFGGSYWNLRHLFDKLKPHTWCRLLKNEQYLETLLKYYQALCEFEMLGSVPANISRVDDVMITSFRNTLFFVNNANASFEEALNKNIKCGLILGSFFSEGSWFRVSEGILTYTKALSDKLPENKESTYLMRMECCRGLFHITTMFLKFEAAEDLLSQINHLRMVLKYHGVQFNYALLFVEFSRYYFLKNNHEEMFKWAHQAMLQLHDKLPVPTIIEVLRQASKACAMEQDMVKAKYLICQATVRAHRYYGRNSYKLAGLLSDLAFYLLNSNQVERGVNMYKKVFRIRKNMFNSNYNCLHNFLIALAEVDLAYAISARFQSHLYGSAMRHAKQAIRILKKLFPDGHLMLTTANRVRAMILEVKAYQQEYKVAQRMLKEAEMIQLDVLRVTSEIFGRVNLQTANQCETLGNLYKNMNRYEEAEIKFLRALHIKEEIFGKDHYEVGVSVSTLANLYNYSMCRYHDAEELYYRSINIYMKIFPRAFFKLEQEYRGLMHVYQRVRNVRLYYEFQYKLNRWNSMSLKFNKKLKLNLHKIVPEPLNKIMQMYFGEQEDSFMDYE